MITSALAAYLAAERRRVLEQDADEARRAKAVRRARRSTRRST
ncbi:MAG TPA: hypothetical protein VFH38_08975 [Jatrophihabitans sp.]|nr:hypothetical protein [Jatrophihabitans sp.]